MTAIEKIELIKKGKLSAEDNIRKFIEKIKKENKELNSVLEINENAIEEAKKIDERAKKGEKIGKLAGLGVIVKANINVFGMHATCASKTLENYKCGYDATVIEKIKEEDGIILGMANMDEFACGSSGETSAFGATKNPRNKELIPGGSSSGSAASVAAGFCDFALGSDTGGSIRNPASHCGVVGIKPSYGFVSRYGLIDLSMSLDQIGIFAENVTDAAYALEIIRGKDEHDPTTKNQGFCNPILSEKIKKLKIGIPKLTADEKIWKLIKENVKKTAEKNNWEVKEIELPHVDLAVQTYYPIVYTEFFSGTRKFDGRRYGKKIEDSCGEEVLRRILGGSEISKAEHHGKYYRQALKVKELIKQAFDEAFKKVDCIILPTVPKLPHKIGTKLSVEDMYSYDPLTIPANLAEIPGISIPAGEINKIPVGMQIFCPRMEDGKMLSIAKEFENL